MRLASPVVAILLCAAALSGCDTLNWEQYRITGAADGSGDEARIIAVVTSIAAESGMARTDPKTHKATAFLAFTRLEAPSWPIDLAVRHDGPDTLIDLSSVFGPRIPAFNRIRARLGGALRTEFGARCIDEQRRTP